MSLLHEIADWMHCARSGGVAVPPSARHASRRVLLDQVGIARAGAARFGPHPVRDDRVFLAGEPPATDWHAGRKVYAPYAALANRCAGDQLELTAGPECVAAAVAAAEIGDATVGDLLRAVALGASLDDYLRGWLGEAVERHGLHPPAVIGTVVAAAVSGWLLELDPVRLAGAMASAACLTPHSPYSAFSHGASGKTIYGGWSQMLGVSCALWARHGMVGPGSALEGSRGLAQALLDAPGGVAPPPFRPDGWPVERVAFKYFPCNRACHPALSALDAVRPIDPAAVESIQVRTYALAVELDRRSRGRSAIAAQMSLRWSLALALVHGDLANDWAYREEVLGSTAVRDLAARITVEPEPRYSAGGQRIRRAAVRVTLSDGRALEAESGARWSTDAPATDQELRERFARLTRGLSTFDPWSSPETQPVRTLLGQLGERPRG